MSNPSVGKPLPTPIFSRGSVRDAEPVRATIRRVRRNRAHGFFALPDGSSQPWFSYAQRDLMCLLAVDPGVREFQTRPVTFRLPIDAAQLDHTPDFRVDRIGERAYVDIVRASDAEKDDQRALIARAMAHECAARGHRFYRIEPAQIYLQPRFGNSQELLRFKSLQPTDEFTFAAIDAISRTAGVSTVGRLEAALGGGDEVVPQIYALALRRVLLLGMGERLSGDTRVDLLAVPQDERR